MSFHVGQPVVRNGGTLRDGQRGTIVERDDGTLGVRLDRGAESLVYPLNERSPDEWVLEVRASLAPMQVAKVAYAADRELRHSKGEYGTKEWMSLTERERASWKTDGPPIKDHDRRALWLAIVAALGA